jgi:hypothetical protein
MTSQRDLQRCKMLCAMQILALLVEVQSIHFVPSGMILIWPSLPTPRVEWIYIQQIYHQDSALE